MKVPDASRHQSEQNEIKTRDVQSSDQSFLLALVRDMTRAQRRVILLTVDLTLVPLALLFTFAVQMQNGPSYEHLGQIGLV